MQDDPSKLTPYLGHNHESTIKYDFAVDNELIKKLKDGTLVPIHDPNEVQRKDISEIIYEW